MSRIIFLLEEASMEYLLRGLLPRLLPNSAERANWVLIPHQGKTDLEASIPRKLKGWREPGVRFVIIRDQDSADCVVVKQRLLRLVEEGGRPDSVVRIACRELESWYFGDLATVAAVYGQPELVDLANKAQYRVPDQIVCPSNELPKHIPMFGKTDAARRLGARLRIGIGENKSKSFQHVLSAITRVAAELAA